jgi:SAM-dependent methyltransferase
MHPPRLVLNAIRYKDIVSVWSTEPLRESAPWIAIQRSDGTEDRVVAKITRISPTRWRLDVPSGANWMRAVLGGTTEDGRSAKTSVVDLSDRSARILPSPLLPDPAQPNSITEYGELFAHSCVQRSIGEVPEQDSVRQAVELLRDCTLPGMTVLDVGCASGHAWRSLRGLGVEYFGIDPYTRAIEIGRLILGTQGLPASRLRDIRLESLPPEERYDVVLSLSTLLYFPMFHEPLALMAQAARGSLIIRSSFGDETEVRFLPDILLEPGYEGLHAYFNIYSRREVQSFLEARGFEVEWHADRRQTEKFAGVAETVGGIDLPYEFLVARRTRDLEDAELLSEHFEEALSRWRRRGEGGPSL